MLCGDCEIIFWQGASENFIGTYSLTSYHLLDFYFLSQGFRNLFRISYHLGSPFFQCVPLLPEQLIWSCLIQKNNLHQNNNKRPQLNLMRFCFCLPSTDWSMHGINLLTVHWKSWCYNTIRIACCRKFYLFRNKTQARKLWLQVFVKKQKLLAYNLEDLRVPPVVCVPQVENPCSKSKDNIHCTISIFSELELWY